MKRNELFELRELMADRYYYCYGVYYKLGMIIKHMFTIVTGHILGGIFPLLIVKNIKFMAVEPVGLLLTYFGVLGLLLFAEYQLVRSIKYGKLYFRVSIKESDGCIFKSCQFSYAVLSGYIIVTFLQNIIL